MGCYPGSPCNPSPPVVYAAYPSNCAPLDNICCPTSTIVYDGPNLPNSGVDNKDTVNVALDKLDDTLNPVSLAQTFINTILTNPSLAVIFCDLVQSCLSTTTTTTTAIPT